MLLELRRKRSFRYDVTSPQLMVTVVPAYTQHLHRNGFGSMPQLPTSATSNLLNHHYSQYPSSAHLFTDTMATKKHHYHHQQLEQSSSFRLLSQDTNTTTPKAQQHEETEHQQRLQTPRSFRFSSHNDNSPKKPQQQQHHLYNYYNHYPSSAHLFSDDFNNTLPPRHYRHHHHPYGGVRGLLVRFRSQPALPVLYAPKKKKSFRDSLGSMTRLLYTPHRGADTGGGRNNGYSPHALRYQSRSQHFNSSTPNLSNNSFTKNHQTSQLQRSTSTVASTSGAESGDVAGAERKAPHYTKGGAVGASAVSGSGGGGAAGSIPGSKRLVGPLSHSTGDLRLITSSSLPTILDDDDNNNVVTTISVGNNTKESSTDKLSAVRMSLYDETGRSGVPVSRSHSFGGVSIRSNTSVGSTGTSTPSVLGEAVRRGGTGAGNRSSYVGRSAMPSPGYRSSRKAAKIPKVPRPARAMMVFDSVKRGIGEFIQATHEDIAQLMASETGTSTAQGRVHETDKQIKSAERYLKRLEFHLAKIDELHDCYLLNQQLREGAKNMARAYSATASMSRKDSLANVKYGYKECSQTMCAIEAQLENMLGTFSCRLKGIAGFARVVPGDVFEVVIKHGGQKWKTKGRIEKNNSQRWDMPEFVFKCLVGETLSIKASEVRAFKTVLLGQKNCEVCHPSTHDNSSQQGLFSANPQLMTVSVNVHGSLKLSIIITWNPLDGMDESVNFYEPPSRSQGSTRRRPMSAFVQNGSLFGSNSDLAGAGGDRRYSIKLRDDSGIYGSASSLPSHMAQEGGRYPHSLSASPVMHSRDPSLTPDLHTGRLRPHSVIASDVRSVRSQPANMTGSASPGGADFNSLSSAAAVVSSSTRPHSAYITSSTYQQQQESNLRTTATPASSSSSSSSSSVFLSQSVLSTSSTPRPIPEVSQSQIPGVAVQVDAIQLDSGLTVEEALGALMTTLEDFLGHYQELQRLEEVLPAIETFIRKPSATSSRSSSMSVSIEGAIEEAFDFLNTEDGLDDFDEKEEEEIEEESKKKSPERAPQVSNIDKLIASPESTAKTADSGIESLAKRLSEADTQLSSSVGSSPIPPSTGNEQVDTALMFHLAYCDKLLENLGNFGPLKCREFYALDRLQKQALILEKLLDIAKQGPEIDLHAVLKDQTLDKSVQELWVLCVEDTALYVRPDKVVSMLENKFGAKMAEHCDIRPSRVFHYLMARILDVPSYIPDTANKSIVTLHQYVNFFREEGGLAKLEKIAQDLHLMDRLSASSSDTVIKAILTLREELPSPACLKMMMKLLAGSNREMQQSAASYLKVINKDKVKRDKAMVILVEGLEDHITEVRAGCCVGLACIEAEESIDQLVHVCHSDLSSTVRRKAKEALYSMGEVGRKAVEEVQLGSQGFQGLQVKKL